MKKIALILTIFITVLSCSSDNSPNFAYELLPVEQAVVPAEMVVDQEYEIQVSYIQPTDCHAFSDFYYEVDGDTRTIAIVSVYSTSGNCTSQVPDNIVERSFTFKPLQATTYTFRFWNGEDENGQDIYTEYQVTATE